MVMTGGLNKVPSHLFHPLGFRVCPVLACYPRRILVGSRGVGVTTKPQRSVPFVNANAQMQNSEKRWFIDDECCSDMDVVKEAAIAVFACVEI